MCTEILDGSLRVDGFRCSLMFFGLWYATVSFFYFEEFIFGCIFDVFVEVFYCFFLFSMPFLVVLMMSVLLQMFW